MTYYQVTKWSGEIKPVEYERVTAKFGFLKGKFTYNGNQQRETLDSEYHRSFPTREEAVTFVHARLIQNKADCAKRLEKLTSELAKFEQKEQL